MSLRRIFIVEPVPSLTAVTVSIRWVWWLCVSVEQGLHTQSHHQSSLSSACWQHCVGSVNWCSVIMSTLCQWNIWVTPCSLSLRTHGGRSASQKWPVRTQQGSVRWECSAWNTWRLVWSYFVVLSTMSLKRLVKSRNCCIRKIRGHPHSWMWLSLLGVLVGKHTCTPTNDVKLKLESFLKTSGKCLLMSNFVITKNNVVKLELREPM